MGVPGVVKYVLRNGMRLYQVRVTAEGEFGVGLIRLVFFELRLRDGQLRFSLVNDALIRTRIYPGADLSLF